MGERGDVSAGTAPVLYEFVGERVGIRADDEAMRARIAAVWNGFRTAAGGDLRALIHIVQRASESPVRHGQQFNNGTLLVIADRHKLITGSLGAMPWQLHIEAYGRSTDFVYYYLFEPLLLMVLKRCNLVHWHGAAVSRNGQVLLIVGATGSGKSTTALSLLLHGYTFVADDELFLREACGRVSVYGLDSAVHFTDETAALLKGLPPLSAASPQVWRGPRRKRRLDAAGMWPTVANGPAIVGPVGGIVFPRIEKTGRCGLRMLSRLETLRRLLQQPPKEYPAAIVDAPSVAQQFAVCAALAETARGVELVLGGDLDRVPALLREAIG